MVNSVPSPQRLLLVSSRARNISQIHNAARSNVKIVQYKYDTSSVETILANSSESGMGKVQSIAFVMHGTEEELCICSVGLKVLSVKSIVEDTSVREFFSILVDNHIDPSFPGSRIDFLATYFPYPDMVRLVKQLEALLRIPVGIGQDLAGSNVKLPFAIDGTTTEITAGQVYFHTNMLTLPVSKIEAPRPRSYKKDDFEKIRTVGKGAFGTAVLYRRKVDDVLVVIKEVNMHDLTASERQLAMNEVRVLSMLNHPNITRYHDSFEDEGVLKIEMEYADGGTLAQLLGQSEKRLAEREILTFFHQIVSALRHMHDHNVLHRDLKTANILLTKEGIIKVGDFGISKMMTTKHNGANTVVGTPYYISPEMCEGKTYDEKSDIWALGCVLYEMACLQKTFEGSNLPALVNKIMKGQFAPVKGNYSHGLKQLIRDLLQRDPEFRPTAAEILQQRLPELLAEFSGDLGYEVDEEMLRSIEQVHHRAQSGSASKNMRSVIYNIRTVEDTISLTPIPLPPRSKILQLALSNTHMIALTSELTVYTWGDGRRGQLGHGTLENYRPRPECVAALAGKSISRVCAGEGFSVFASNSGIVMTCGDGTAGCLGHGDWNCASKPKLLEKLLSVDVSAIACGEAHVVVLSGDGEVFSWGRGAGGRLGLGHEDDCCTPTQITTTKDQSIRNVKCGRDGTMFITQNSQVFACGNNRYNKLGLNENSGIIQTVLIKTEVIKKLVLTPVKCLNDFQVVDISMGPNHTSVLVEPGHVITFGRNSEGQLGKGHTRAINNPTVVKNMTDKTTLMVECGETFTVVGTLENVIYLWGTRYVMCAPTRPPTQNNSRAFLSSTDLSENVKMNQRDNLDQAEAGFTLIPEDGRNGETNDFSSKYASMNGTGNFPSLPRAPITAKYKSDHFGPRMKDVLLQPQEILALYASPAQIIKGETVNLSSIRCQGQNIFLVIDTTAPLPNQMGKRPKSSNNQSLSLETERDISSAGKSLTLTPSPDLLRYTPEVDTIGPVPDWLKQELENSEVPWSGYSTGDRKILVRSADRLSQSRVERSERSKSARTAKAFTQTRPSWELKQELEILTRSKEETENRLKQMDAEFQTKEKELRQQADERVKERERVLTDEIERLRQELQEQIAHFQAYSRRINEVQVELQENAELKANGSKTCLLQ